MEHQHEVAVAQEYSFLETQADVRKAAEGGILEPVGDNADYTLSNVSFPFAIREVRMFIERIAPQYRAATGERLVVTSLTRPISLQPPNAHVLSVHPAGMAIDLRVPANAKSRAWLEQTLLELESEGVLDVTREHTPSHYHVAVFPADYRAYVNESESVESATELPAYNTEQQYAPFGMFVNLAQTLFTALNLEPFMGAPSFELTPFWSPTSRSWE